MKETVRDYAIDQLKRHGLPFIMMGIAIWFLYNDIGTFKGEVIELRAEVKACNDMLIEKYSDDHEKMTRVITENTNAIRNLVK